MERASVHVVFLSANDVYKLLPDDDGCGGIAQFATLLDTVRARLPQGAHPIVTLNGDFLWRSELQPPYKAEMMIRMLELLGIEYVVLGNHEFDFGAQRCRELVSTMKWTVLGSNARLRGSNELFPGVTDYHIATLPGPEGLKLGLFGLLTSNPHEFVNPNDPLVVMESEVDHAKRCVQALQALGADVVVAITHTRLAKDRLIARQVAGIHLILGGHDHEPVTMLERTTLIHKSGCDALWLGQVDCFITQEREGAESHVDVQFGWKMKPNRGYEPKPEAQLLLNEYFAKVATDLSRPDMDTTLAISTTRLDGTRASLRSHETNLGNLVADAIRAGMHADVAFINGGFIQGERSYRSGLKITRSLLCEILPIPNIARCVAVHAEALKRAFLKYLIRYPDENSLMPHVSGVYLVVSLNHTTTARDVCMYYDQAHEHKIPSDTVLRVATSVFMLENAEGCEGYASAKTLVDGPIIRELVVNFLETVPTKEISYFKRLIVEVLLSRQETEQPPDSANEKALADAANATADAREVVLNALSATQRITPRWFGPVYDLRKRLRLTPDPDLKSIGSGTLEHLFLRVVVEIAPKMLRKDVENTPDTRSAWTKVLVISYCVQATPGQDLDGSVLLKLAQKWLRIGLSNVLDAAETAVTSDELPISLPLAHYIAALIVPSQQVQGRFVQQQRED